MGELFIYLEVNHSTTIIAFALKEPCAGATILQKQEQNNGSGDESGVKTPPSS